MSFFNRIATKYDVRSMCDIDVTSREGNTVNVNFYELAAVVAKVARSEDASVILDDEDREFIAKVRDALSEVL